MSIQVDLNHIEARHDEINLRLERWARWVTVRQRSWGRQPMFLGYVSKARQWETEPHIHVETNTLEACETERAVSFLPEPHRTAIRWFYVFPNLHCNAVQRKLGATKEGLAKILTDGRDMLKNRLREKLVDEG